MPSERRCRSCRPTLGSTLPSATTASLSLWHNGVIVASRAINLPLDAVDSSLSIGVEDSATSYFNGLISHVALYGQALSAARMQAHVQAAGLASNAVVAPTVAPGDGQATLSWTAPSYSAETITGYEVQWGTTPTLGTGTAPNYPTTGAFVLASARSYTATGLTNATEYAFRVRAISASGAGQWSTNVVTLPFGQAAAPNGLAATMSSGSIALSWTAPTTTTVGRTISTVTGYRIEQNTGAGWVTLSGNAGTGTSFTVNGRQLGTLVSFRVAAVTTTGLGEWANVSITPTATPSAPRNLAAAAVSNGSVSLTWAAPLTDGDRRSCPTRSTTAPRPAARRRRCSTVRFRHRRRRTR